MGLSRKSPYSSSVNPAIYNFVYALGTFLGSTRSFNAKLFLEEYIYIQNSVNLAAFVAYHTKNWVRVTLVCENESILRANDQLKLKEANSYEVHNHIYVYNQIKKVKCVVFAEIKKELREQLNKYGNMRD